MSTPDPVVVAPIREPLLRGHHAVAGLWFPADWFDEAARAARLIACWRPGASAWRFEQGDLLCFAAPFEDDCDELPGWPLRIESGALCSASLTQRESAIGREGDVWIVRGAQVLTLHKRDATPLDPSSWLAVEDTSLHDTYDLRGAIPPAVVLDLESRPLREVLGNVVGAESPERAGFLDALRRVHEKQSARGRQPARQVGNSQPETSCLTAFIVGLLVLIVVIVALSAISRGSFPFALIIVIAMAIGLMLSLGKAGDGRGGASYTRRRPGSRPVGAIPTRTKLAHPQRWRRWLARIAATTQLSRLLGREHAKHLRRVLDYFDDGNLEEALRHAIPLDGEMGSLGESFGMPGRRGSLELSRTYGPSTSVYFGDDMQQHLRSVYRRAFEKLDHEQRYDEAVFVLAELLNARKEALDYLEKHGQFNKAAELALGWEMPADVIVRLQCLAGDWRRAIAVARRDDAFAAAVLQLEKRWPDAARRLREEWAKSLVQKGNWLGAVDAVWPIESLRGEATQWLLTAEAAGGELGARALVQRALLLPDTLERYAGRLQGLQCDREQWRDRLSVVEALSGLRERTPVTQNLAALIAPAVLADHAQGNRRFDMKSLQQFVQSTGDAMLLADLPNGHWRALQVSPIASVTPALRVEAPAAGTFPVLDVVPLDDQRHLVALGESGACVVDAGGRVIARFAVPAEYIVIAHSRQVALLLARREKAWRVSRLDLARKRVMDLGMLIFDFWAPQFDGINWTIAQGRALRVLDTQDSLRHVVWQVPDLPGRVCALTATSAIEQIVCALDEGKLEFWSYRLPQRQLRQRDDLPMADGRSIYLNPTGGSLSCDIAHPDDGRLQLTWRSAGRSGQLTLPPSSPETLGLSVWGDWLVIRSGDDSGWEIRWVWLSSATEHAHVQWPSDALPIVRPIGDEWLVHDARGRLLSINVTSGVVQSFGVR